MWLLKNWTDSFMSRWWSKNKSIFKQTNKIVRQNILKAYEMSGEMQTNSVCLMAEWISETLADFGLIYAQ